MPINWTPDTLAKARTRLAALTQEIAEERAVADALANHADEHRQHAFRLEAEAAGLEQAVANGEKELGGGQ